MFDRLERTIVCRSLLMITLLIALYPLTSCVSPVINTIVVTPTTTKIKRVYTSTGDVAAAADQPTVQLTATGSYLSDSSSGTTTTVTKDVTSSVNWQSYSTSLVTVNCHGLAQITGALGSTQITASMDTVRGAVYSNSVTFVVKK